MTESSPTAPTPSEAHFAISEKAAVTLSGWLDGNGVTARQVRLGRQNTVVHQLIGAIRVRLKPEISKNELPGRNPQGQLLESDTAVTAQSESLVSHFIGAEGVRQEILQAIQKTPGKGFGMDPLVLPLHQAKKDFSVVGKCLTCGGGALIPCGMCQATGSISCMACNAQGFSACQSCYGSGRIQQGGGGTQSCSRCQGAGRITCAVCQSQRAVVCTVCRGQCKMGCAQCNQSGFITHVYHVAYRAECLFELDASVCPADVQKIIVTIGIRQLAVEDHAEIVWQSEEVKGNDMFIPCVALLPVAEAEFSVEGKVCPVTVFGLQGRIVQMEPLLDTLLKPGITALTGLSKGPMASQPLIDTACKYRIIRQTIGRLVRHPKKVVYQRLIKDYPVVLSAKCANTIVRDAATALLSIGAAPRNKGLVAGTILGALLAAGYYMTLARSTILTLMLERHIGRHILLVDIMIWLLGWALTVFIIKSMTAKIYRELLPDSIRTDKKRLPSAGSQGFWSLLTTFAGWFVIAVFVAEKPGWVILILQGLKIVP